VTASSPIKVRNVAARKGCTSWPAEIIRVVIWSWEYRYGLIRDVPPDSSRAGGIWVSGRPVFR
jgi:hypothetical protein